MQLDVTYRRSFWAAVVLHGVIIISLLIEMSSPRPVLHQESQSLAGKKLPVSPTDVSENAIVKAVSVDNQDVVREMNRIKQAKAQEQQVEMNRQNALKKEAELARQARVAEQQKLQKLKQEAEKLAIARKKQAEEEQKRLKQLAIEKEKQARELEKLKHQQALLKEKKEKEAKKLAQLKKQQEEKKAQAAQEKEKQLADEKAAHDKALLAQKEAQKKAAAMQQAQDDAEQRAKMAGEVDRYKAMILDAIGRQWILPENIDNRLSSVFHIRLAPDGGVLEVSLVKSSGDPLLDRSAQTAIYKASPLPVPHDALVFNVFRDINLTVRPENIRG